MKWLAGSEMTGFVPPSLLLCNFQIVNFLCRSSLNKNERTPFADSIILLITDKAKLGKRRIFIHNKYRQQALGRYNFPICSGRKNEANAKQKATQKPKEAKKFIYMT